MAGSPGYRTAIIATAIFLHFFYPEEPGFYWKIFKGSIVVFFIGYRLVEDGVLSNDSLVHVYAWWTRVSPRQPAESELDPSQELAVNELAKCMAEAFEKSKELRELQEIEGKATEDAKPKPEAAKPKASNKKPAPPRTLRSERSRRGGVLDE